MVTLVWPVYILVILARYLRDLPPDEGGRSIKDRKNNPLGVALEMQLW